MNWEIQRGSITRTVHPSPHRYNLQGAYLINCVPRCCLDICSFAVFRKHVMALFTSLQDYELVGKMKAALEIRSTDKCREMLADYDLYCGTLQARSESDLVRCVG